MIEDVRPSYVQYYTLICPFKRIQQPRNMLVDYAANALTSNEQP